MNTQADPFSAALDRARNDTENGTPAETPSHDELYRAGAVLAAVLRRDKRLMDARRMARRILTGGVLLSTAMLAAGYTVLWTYDGLSSDAIASLSVALVSLSVALIVFAVNTVRESVDTPHGLEPGEVAQLVGYAHQSENPANGPVFTPLGLLALKTYLDLVKTTPTLAQATAEAEAMIARQAETTDP